MNKNTKTKEKTKNNCNKKGQQDSFIKNLIWIIVALILLGVVYFVTKALFNRAG